MTITLVTGQTASNVTSGVSTGGTSTVTLPNAPTPGNLVLLGLMGFSSAVSAVSVADASSNGYAGTAHTPLIDNGGSGATIGCYFLKNAPSGANKQINATWTLSSGTLTGIMFAAEFAGADTVSPFDVDANQSGGAGASTLSITPTQTGDVFIGFGHDPVGITGAGSPWTLLGSIFFGGDAAEYSIQTGPAAARPLNFTGSSASGGIYMNSSFKASAAPSVGSTLLYLGAY